MPTSLSKPDSRRTRGRWAATALLLYGAMCVGLLGYFIVFPDEATLKSQAERRLDPDPGYEGVIGNWARYRARNLRAEAK